MQRALLQWYKPDNFDTVRKALYRAGRQDLIGFGPDCLVKPRTLAKEKTYGKKETSKKDMGKKPFSKKPVKKKR